MFSLILMCSKCFTFLVINSFCNFRALTLFKLRLGASRGRLVGRSVGWSVGLWVCLRDKIRTKIQDKRTAVEHQVKNKSC